MFPGRKKENHTNWEKHDGEQMVTDFSFLGELSFLLHDPKITSKH